jgi:isopenicillin N synthase-like dioxygenase
MKTITNIEATNIPVIDLSLVETDREALVQAIGDGFRENGFIAVKNHGINPSLFEKNYKLLKDVFGLSEQVKQKYNHPELGNQRGYLPLDGEIHPGSTFRDLKTCWQIGRNNLTNIYPSEISTFGEYNYELFQELERVGVQIIECLDTYLDAEGILIGLLKNENEELIGNHLFRSIFYPRISEKDLKNITNQKNEIIRGAAHVDLNLITLLPTSTNEGLQILQKDGSWLTVNTPPDYIIVNVADMLHLITKGTEKELASIPHRIIATNKTVDEDRYSMPMFIHPSHKLPLVNLKTKEPVKLNHGLVLDKSGKYVHWRLQCILPEGSVPNYEEWEKSNNLLM